MSAPDADAIPVAVARAVARARDEDVQALPPLGSVVDAEALGQFVANGSRETEVELEIYGCRVVVGGDGSVSVTRLDEE